MDTKQGSKSIQCHTFQRQDIYDQIRLQGKGMAWKVSFEENVLWVWWDYCHMGMT